MIDYVLKYHISWPTAVFFGRGIVVDMSGQACDKIESNDIQRTTDILDVLIINEIHQLIIYHVLHSSHSLQANAEPEDINPGN